MAVLDWLHAATSGILHNVHDVALSSPSTASSIPHPGSETMASSLPSLRTLSKVAFTGAGSLLGQGQQVLGGPSETCSNPQLSCHNTTVVENLCCFNAPGGQLLQTQFWDTDPATGPDDSWTIHGLWYALIFYSNL
jgi:ribonuclease T2